MSPLFYKELRSLRPFLGLVTFFMLLSAVNVVLSEFPDQYPLSKMLKDSDGDAVIIFVVAFALAAGLLVRERDEGTLAFLDALPISRTRIFFCKVILGLAVLWLMPLSDLALKVGAHAWSRTSLEKTFQWQILLMGAGLGAACCFVYFSIGLALSFLRRFSLLVMGLGVCGYLALQEAHVPWVSLFNIFALGDPVYEGQRWLLPAAKLTAQLSLGGAALTVAFVSFLNMGDSAQRMLERAKRRRSIMFLTGLGTTCLVLIWAGLAAYWLAKNSENDRTHVRYENWALGRIKTARFNFVYPQNLASLASQLAERADAAEARVREFLGATRINRIEADLTGSAPETSGQAHWKKVQMDLVSSGSEVGSLVAVLGHETTHVYIDHESEARVGDDFNSTRFFHEGLASYVEYHLFRPTNRLSALHEVAAVMRARDEVKMEELLNNEEMGAKRDSDLVYPLGEIFVEALVQQYGQSAPGKVIRAFARPSAPKDLSGFALWQDVLQACGYNLSSVEDAFFEKLDESVREQRAFVDALPRLRGVVQPDPVRLVVQANYEGQAPGRLVCRFRSQARTPPHLYEEAYAEPGNLFWVDATGYAERSFWYQLGWRVRGSSQTIYEPWVEALRNR